MQIGLAVLVLISMIIISCNNPNSNAKGHKKLEDSAVTASDNRLETTDPGGRMIAANDCYTCHNVKGVKTVGPTFEQIAAKYELNEGNISNLSRGIIEGSKGIWGDNQMIPHQNVTPQDAALMAKYILSLRSKE